MKIVLIRHGITEANERHLYCGSTDICLSSNGRQMIAERVSDGSYPDLSGLRIITSGMKRCEETLDLILGDVMHEQDPAFREMDFGVFEMRSYEEMKEDPVYLEWISGDNETNIAPQGESGAVMTDRVIKGIGSVIADGSDALIVTHGGVIAAVMAYLFPGEGKNRYQWQPGPGGGYEIDTAKRSYLLF